MKRQIKITAAVIALILLVFCFGLSPATAAEVQLVRVKLSVSGASVSIKVSGAYHIDGDIDLPAGSYKVSVSGDNIRIKGGSIDQTVSAPLTLVRDEKGVNTKNISVSGTKYGTCSYLGNMTFYAQSGKILVVNTLPVEQYLYGVVAYEMSNSFPLEALKAQAVCARGYVLKSLSSSGTYDIGDTSSDQVYHGYNPDYKNVIAAVDGTKGQVLTYQNKIITTYYAASNGGQTELPGNAWGGGASKNKSYPYLVQKDDPYDLENPSSMEQIIFVPSNVKDSDQAAVEAAGGQYVRIVNVNTACNVRSGPDASTKLLGQAPLNSLYPLLGVEDNWFKIKYKGQEAYVINTYAKKVTAGRFVYSNSVLSDLQNQAKAALASKKITVDDSTDIQILSVNSFVNGKERWPDTGSRSYVTANANITVQYYAKGSDEKSKATKLNVTISLMDNKNGSYVLAHDYLNSNLRLRGIEKAKGGFNVTARRFGHGVGMSQRGAQTMAKNHGKSYKEILAFYFQGAKLSTVPNTGATPAPEPTATSGSSAATISSSKHKISGSTVTGLSENLKVSAFMGNFTVKNGSIKLYGQDGKEKTSGVVCTGDVLRLLNSSGKTQKNYTAVLYGDVNMDGKITVVDLLRVQKHLLGTAPLSGAGKAAADVSKDGDVKLLDLLRIQKHLLGTQSIAQ